MILWSPEKSKLDFLIEEIILSQKEEFIHSEKHELFSNTICTQGGKIQEGFLRNILRNISGCWCQVVLKVFIVT